ncbi:RluA family pseudouridine synthase [Candidatus Microgenomates bacterium]|nr:RluA family pseudouridine synthase [Candidatus Microgenomates bacterium]
MQVIYEDKSVLVVDKPAGMSVHPGHGHKGEKTVVDFVRDKVADPDKERPGIVHRLDRDTSGVLIIAKNPKAKAFLQQQFKARKVKKTYIVLVHGVPKLRHAILEWPIGRHPKNPLKRSVKGSGKPAITEYKIVKAFQLGKAVSKVQPWKREGVSLLEVYPQSGRTHQIRVHLSHLGYPIVGDKLYGRTNDHLNRQFLHAAKLTLKLLSGQPKTFVSPLPKALGTFLATLS